MYSEYCTCFYNGKEKVIVWDEIKNKTITTIPAANETEATKIMRKWKAEAPMGMICELI